MYRALTVLLQLFIYCTAALLHGQERSVIRFGSDILVASNEQIKDAVALGGDITVEGEVTNDAVAIGGSVLLTSGSVIGGNAVSIGGEILQHDNSIVRGDIVEISAPWHITPGETWYRIFIGMRILTFIGFLALSLLIVALFPQQLLRVSENLRRRTLHALLWGVIAAVAIIPLIFVLTISIIGIALIPLLIIVLILAIITGYIAVALQAGDAIFHASHKPQTAPIWKTFVGVIVLGVISFIPILGGLIGTIIFILGTGAVIDTLIKSRAGKIKLSEQEQNSNK
ncbi:hypothetical protein CHISP_2067 [Chitinispirillum alkaliphilum]|nr:hypothetical protein CHISP_2067 [Chitinispirillum alkaliphilum]